MTLRVDCGEAALAPALTLMDVIELMGVPVRALCLGQVAAGAVGVVAVCSHRSALPSTRFSLSEPTTELQAHVRNVAQWAELRAAERQRFCARVGCRHRPGRRPRSSTTWSGGASSARRRRWPTGSSTRWPDPTPRCGSCPDRVRRPWGSGRCADGDGRRSARETGPVLRAYDAAMTETGPRLPPLAAGEWDDVLTRVLENSPGGTDEPMHIFTTLGRADPELFRRWLGFGGALLAGTLPGRLRELVILRTADRFGGRYEWAQHLELAEAQGVTPAELAAVSDGDAGSTQSSGRRWSGPRCGRSTRRPTRAPSPTPPGRRWPNCSRERAH